MRKSRIRVEQCRRVGHLGWLEPGKLPHDNEKKDLRCICARAWAGISGNRTRSPERRAYTETDNDQVGFCRDTYPQSHTCEGINHDFARRRPTRSHGASGALCSRIRDCRRDLGEYARLHLFRFILCVRLNVKYRDFTSRERWDGAFSPVFRYTQPLIFNPAGGRTDTG